MAVNVRFNTIRLEQKMSRALAAADDGNLLNEYNRAADEVNRDVSTKIRDSGRGGSHNADFARQDKKVFRASSGRYNVMVGWINPASGSEERGSSGRLWYQYQDSGFHLFGGSQWISGVGATIDRRENLLDAIEDINRRYLAGIAKELNR